MLWRSSWDSVGSDASEARPSSRRSSSSGYVTPYAMVAVSRPTAVTAVTDAIHALGSGYATPHATAHETSGEGQDRAEVQAAACTSERSKACPRYTTPYASLQPAEAAPAPAPWSNTAPSEETRRADLRDQSPERCTRAGDSARWSSSGLSSSSARSPQQAWPKTEFSNRKPTPAGVGASEAVGSRAEEEEWEEEEEEEDLDDAEWARVKDQRYYLDLELLCSRPSAIYSGEIYRAWRGGVSYAAEPRWLLKPLEQLQGQ